MKTKALEKKGRRFLAEPNELLELCPNICPACGRSYKVHCRCAAYQRQKRLAIEVDKMRFERDLTSAIRSIMPVVEANQRKREDK